MRAIRSGELADRAFARLAGKASARDRPWLHELVYGTLRLRGRLDYLLDRFVKRGVQSLDGDTLDVLRLGAYQLLEMNSVPAYAAVSQSVEVAKSLRVRGAPGLVNGVLQSLRRAQSGSTPPSLDQVDQLSKWGSHPRWLVERWLARFGAETVARIVAANNQRPEIYIRPVGISLVEALATAAERAVVLERVSHAPDALRLVEGSVFAALAAVPAIVQDPAAGLVARYVGAPGGVVADLCAAPGGKAIAIASSLGENGVVIAGDIAESRLQRALENRARVGGLPLYFMVADGRRPAITAADVVLIDAPCTGSGTFRRHPDGKWRVGPDDLRSLVQLQQEILDAASAIVKVGGVLVYATCSIEPEENQEQVRAFLDRHPNFLRRPPAAWPEPAMMDEIGSLVIMPHDFGFDGAFAARLERVA